MSWLSSLLHKSNGAALADDPVIPPENEEDSMFKDTNTPSKKQDDMDVPAVSGRDFEKKLRWMISNPPKGAVKVKLTPSMARTILARNEMNRPLTKTRVSRLAREIAAGHWVWTGQPIIISDDGALLDGQHRLEAVVESGISIPITLLFGVPKTAFDKIDIGSKRTTADIFSIHGEKHYAALASSARIVWRYENSGMIPAPHVEPEAAELWHYMNDRHPALRNYMPKIGLFIDAGWGIPATFLALHYLCSLKGKQAAEDFFYQLATGNDIGTRAKKHPINSLRHALNADMKERALGRGMSAMLKAAYTVKAWNKWRRGEELGVFRWRGAQRPDEPFPRIK